MNVKQTALWRMIGLLLCLCMTVCLATACGNDQPPSDETPEPAPHVGMFLSEYGSLTYNGDGKTVYLDVNDAFAAASGLPAGHYYASYVYLFHNEQWRYDKAETFRITVDGKAHNFQSFPDATDSEIVAFSLPDGTTATFIKDV